MNPEQSFGRFVRNCRRKLDLTQEELARRVGCAAITLRKIEADDARPSVQIAERLAMALAIPLEERAEFVRRARLARPEPAIIETPAPTPTEIGNEDLTGRAIRGYALAERVGNGGMGVVYRAMQPLVEREVALKIILPVYANHPDFIRRFEAEAQLVARLEHPHIVPLYDYWREPNVAYLVMRLLRGGSVQHLLEQGPLLPEQVLRIAEQVGSALGAAHRAGVVHRDLKPANVLLDEDNNAYLADFGIAKNLSNPNLENATGVDAIVGSPDYMSPEQIRSEFVKPQTDIYCFGVMLYELLTGVVPFQGATPIHIMHQHLTASLPPLAANRVGLPRPLDEVIAQATMKEAHERYADMESLLVDLRHAIQGTRKSQPEITEQPENGTHPLTAADNPYKGLRAFGEGDAVDFFGRETLIQQLLLRLGESGDLSRFLAVVGPSGSGKSSVVKAGLIPALRRGGLTNSDNWFIVEMTPGAFPLEELETALLRIAVNPPASLINQLREDKRGLLRCGLRCLPFDPGIELVLVIDQFEEVFTLVPDEATRIHFLDLLLNAALDERSRVRIVVTLRADFIDRPLNYVDFGELVRQRMEVVLPLTPDELEQAIVKPAERVDLEIESGLVPVILRDLGEQPGSLPLLQYALTELFEKRTDNLLTKSAYQSIGGVLGALGRKAEEVFAGLVPESQTLAQQLFLRLVTLGEGIEDTRRRVLRSELEAITSFQLPITKVIESFGRHHLLAFDRDPVTRSPTVEVAHEALIREWSRLRSWLNESRDDVRLQRQLAIAAAEWQNANRDPIFLLSGTRLAQFEGWITTTSIALTPAEHIFIEASVSERQTHETEEQTRRKRELEAAHQLANEQKRANRWLVSALLGIGTFLILTLCAACAATGATGLAVQQSFVALARQLTSQAQSQLSTNPEVAVLLALEAERYSKTDASTDVLASAPFVYSPIQATLSGHTDWINSVAWSPDGQQLASVANDETIIIWDAASGQPQMTLNDDRGFVYSVAWSPDGKRLASGSYNSAIIIWDLASGQPQTTLIGHNGGVKSVVWSPDGNQLASGSEDNTVIIWDVASGQALVTLKGHGDTIRLSWSPSVDSVAWSPDGKRLASGARDGTVIVWDVASGQPRSKLQGHTDIIHSVVWSPDGQFIASGSGDSTVIVWDVATGKPQATLEGHSNWVQSVAWSPDGKRLASGSGDDTIIIWDTASYQPQATLQGHTSVVGSLAWRPDGKQLASGAWTKTSNVIIWDMTSGPASIELQSHKGTVVGSMAWSPDGQQLASTLNNHTIVIWDVVSGQPQTTLRGNTDVVISVVWSPDGKQLASGLIDNTIIIWDVASGQSATTLQGHTGNINSLAWSPDGKQLASGSQDNTVIVWDMANGQPLATLAGHTATIGVAKDIYSPGVLSVGWSPDSKQLASGAGDGTVIIWDAASFQPQSTLKGHTEPVYAVAWSPDGKQLASGGWDTKVIIWDVTSSQPSSILSDSPNLIYGLTWSPDGKQIAAHASNIYTNTGITIWDVDEQRVLTNLKGPTGPVGFVAWSPDGNQLAISSGSTITLLQTRYLRPPCELVSRNLTKVEWQNYMPWYLPYHPTCEQWPSGQ